MEMMASYSCPKGYKQTEVGVIPEDWVARPVSTFGDVVTGGTPSTEVKSYWQGEYPWVTPTDISTRRDIYTSERCISASGLKTLHVLPANAVLVTCIASIGKNAVLKADGACNQQINAVIPNKNHVSEFLYYVFENSKAYLLANAGITATRIISKAVFKELPFPLPSTKGEQEAIAGALSDADALIESLEQLVAKERLLKKGTMQELLTGKKRLPGFSGKWDQISLGEMFTFKNGLNKSKEFFGHGTPIVNYMDVFGSPTIYSARLVGRVSLTNEETKNFDVKKGDVFFTRTSETREEIGLASVVLDKPIQTVFSGFVLRGRPRDERLCNEFKAYCFRSELVRSQIISKASYTTRALTNGRILSAVVLPVPAKTEQTAIATILSDMDAEIAALEAKLAKVRSLKQGMMHMLLTGRIRLV